MIKVLLAYMMGDLDSSYITTLVLEMLKFINEFYSYTI